MNAPEVVRAARDTCELELNGEPLLANRIMDGSGASTFSDRFAAFNAAVRSPVE